MTYSYDILVNLLNIVTAMKVEDKMRIINISVKIYNRIQDMKKLDNPNKTE